MPGAAEKRSERQPGDAISSLRSAFERVAAEAPGELRIGKFRILERSVTLHTVGARLHQHLTSALSHLADDTSHGPSRGLSAFVWDFELAGKPHVGVQLSGSPVDDETIEVSDDNRWVRNRRGQWLLELDRRHAEIIGCARLSALRPLLHDLGKPLQTLISVWARDLGIPLIHAGMVARGETGVLLGGTGGAGKSTTTVACARQGLDFLGDDRVGLQASEDGFVGHSLYNSVLLDQQQLERFPDLLPHAVAPEHPTRERKPLVFLSRIYPLRLRRSAPIRAVVVPVVGQGSASRVSAISPAEALRCIAPSSLVLPAGPGAVGMKRLGELVRAVPCYRLELGTDLAGVVAAVEGLLEKPEP